MAHVTMTVNAFVMPITMDITAKVSVILFCPFCIFNEWNSVGFIIWIWIHFLQLCARKTQHAVTMAHVTMMVNASVMPITMDMIVKVSEDYLVHFIQKIKSVGYTIWFKNPFLQLYATKKQPAVTMAHVKLMVNAFVKRITMDMIVKVSVILFCPFY
jgi:hypothetical protein